MILFYIILFTFIGSIASLVGSFFLLLRKTLTETFSASLVDFAAGVLLAVAFLDLFPEAAELSAQSSVFVPAFAGFVGFFFAERFMYLFHHHHGHGEKPTTLLVIVGDGVHNFIDGVVITASFLTSVPLGITTSLAVAAHEIPQEIADMGILLSNGLSKSRALFYNFLSALTALLGALVAYFFGAFVQQYIYVFLSVAAGFFIYIAASDLIPQMHEGGRGRNKAHQISIFTLGIAIIFISTKVLGG